MGIGNLGGFNPNINLNKLGGNQKSNANEKTENKGAEGNAVNNAPQKEVQASALEMLGNLNKGLIVGGKVKDLPNARIDDKPTIQQNYYENGGIYYFKDINELKEHIKEMEGKTVAWDNGMGHGYNNFGHIKDGELIIE